MLPFFRGAAQYAQAAALGLASYRARLKLEFLQDGALNFAGIARVHLLWSSRVQELRVCHAIDEFRSLYSTQCPYTVYTLVFASLVVNVRKASSQQSLCA